MNSARPRNRPQPRKSKHALIEDLRKQNACSPELEARLYNLQIENDTLTGVYIPRTAPLNHQIDEQVYTDLMQQPPSQILKNLKWVGDHIDSLSAEITDLETKIRGKGTPEKDIPGKNAHRHKIGGAAEKGRPKELTSGHKHSGIGKRRMPTMESTIPERGATTSDTTGEKGGLEGTSSKRTGNDDKSGAEELVEMEAEDDLISFD